MEEMKYVENSSINEKVSKIIEDLRDEIISNFHPKSIILTGSFGREEGTVIEENGKLKFLSDCEIAVIPYKYILNRSKINEFKSNFYDRTGLKVGIGGVTLSFYLMIPFINKKMKPTMANYDLKYGSKVIYGKNYLERIPNFKREDIPLWEGIRLLFNRMAEALEHFSFENPNKEMIFWTNKIVLACQDALLLSLGKYHHSYRKRNEMFKSLFSKHFSELEDELPNLLGLTREATERKLNRGVNVDDPVKYWFDTAKICDKVFRYVIKKDMGIEFRNYLEFQEKYIENASSRKFISIFHNIKTLARIAILSKNIPSIKLLAYIKMPLKHTVYSIIPLTYFDVVKQNCNKEANKKIDEIVHSFLHKKVCQEDILCTVNNLWRLYT